MLAKSLHFYTAKLMIFKPLNSVMVIETYFRRLLIFVCVMALLAPAGGFAAAKTAPKTNNSGNWGVSADDLNKASDAKRSAGRDNWKDAQKHADRSGDTTVKKVFRWLHYTTTAKGASFKEITDFIIKNPDWPKQDTLLVRAEEAMADDTPDAEIIEFFRDDNKSAHVLREPSTSKGKLRLAKALIAKRGYQNNVDSINKLVRASWVDGNWSSDEERDFLKDFGKIIREEDEVNRIDRLLWDNQYNAARRNLRLVNAGYQKLFDARLALLQDHGNIDSLLRAVPDDLRDDQGLLFARMQWRHSRKRKSSVEEILNDSPPEPKFPEKWWTIKSYYIREMLDRKEYANAYKIASTHGMSTGAPFAEAEWLSGWIALRFLQMPKDAYKHFYSLYQGVTTPISKSRGAYWAGRAAKADGNDKVANNWFSVASQFSNTFYGQLAAHELGRATLSAPEIPRPTAEDEQAYHRSELVKAAYILYKIGYDKAAKSFLKEAVADAKTPGEALLITRFGRDVGEPSYSVSIAKEVNQSNGLLVVETFYPTIKNLTHIRSRRPLTKPEPALVHAIILQESMFDKGARSAAGAMGLMQLMPHTANMMARREKVSYSRAKLVTDINYNVTLGASYIEDIIDMFDGSYILGIAAYNGGPRNAKEWIEDYGDPRKMRDLYDVIDWIEKIPFKETRNYVQRVMENTEFYRYRLNPNDPAPLHIERDLMR